MITNAVELWEIGRATLLVSVSTLLIAGLWRWRNPTSPAILRSACLLILVQGWFIYRLSIAVPWHDAPAVQPTVIANLPLDDVPAMPSPRARSSREPSEIVVAPAVHSWRRPTINEMMLALWLTGPLVLAGLLVRDFRRFFVRVADAEMAPEEWREQWKSVCQSAGVRKSIPMLATDDVGPLLCWNAAGYRLLVPVNYWSELSFDQREAVLRHELAHYERGDIWKSLFVRLLAIPQWFNPFAWRLVRWFDEGAEQACDRAVLTGAPHLASQYARALLSLGQTPSPTISFASSANGSTLARRIRMIVVPAPGSESHAKQIILLSLPFVLTIAGLIRVELVAKEPAPADLQAPTDVATVQANLAVVDNDGAKLLAEIDKLNESLPKLEAQLPELRKKLETLAAEAQKLSEEAENSPGNIDVQSRAQVKKQAVLEATDNLGRLREELEQGMSDRDELQKKLKLRKRTIHSTFVLMSQGDLNGNLSHDAWFVVATLMLAAETGSQDELLGERVHIYHGVASRDWKGTNLDRMRGEWEKATRGEKLNEFPTILRSLIKARMLWQSLLDADELQRQFDRDRKSFELMKAAVAFQQQGESASDYWRRQVDQHPQNANDYRLAYLASIAREGAQPVDISLAEPLIPGKAPTDAYEFVGLCEILRNFVVQSRPDGVEFIRLRQKLVDLLSDGSATEVIFASRGTAANAQVPALDRLYQSYRKAGRDSEAEAILRSLLAADPRLYEWFAARVHIPPGERRQWHMDRPVRFAFKNTPLSKAIDEMFDSVVLPCWVDSTAIEDETLVQWNGNGRWIDVLRQLLSTTKYELHFLNENVMWIGPQAERQPAETLFGRALLRVPAGDSPIAVKLQKPISVDFVDTPIEDVSSFLADYLHVNLLTLASEKSISIDLRSLPTFLALSLICAQLELDWCTEEGVIFLGSSQQIERVQERGSAYRRRAVDLERQATSGNVAAKALSQPISFDFIETPLIDIVEFFGDYSRVMIVLDSKDAAELPTTLQLEQVSMGWALELILMEHDLHWELLGNMVFIGAEAKVSAARSKIQERIAKREAYPQSLRTELVKDVQIEAEKAPLFAIVESLAKSVQAPIETSEKARLRQVTFRAEPMPLDIALDLLCLQNDLSWRWTADGVIRFE